MRCIHWRLPATYRPVSSWCSTSACVRAALICASTGERRSPQRCTRVCSVPSLIVGPVPFLHHFAGPFIRHQLLLHQVDPYRPKRRSILHRRSHILRKVGLRHLLAHGTDFSLARTFSDSKPLRKQINHLPTFHSHMSPLAQF